LFGTTLLDGTTRNRAVCEIIPKRTESYG
jgi:hypothetical protein